MKKISLALLVLALLASACGQDTPASDLTSSRNDSTAPTLYSHNGEFDFGGDTVTFLVPNWTTLTTYFSEEMTGDIVDDAAFSRELAVENELNINIETIWDESGANAHKMLQTAVSAGDAAYDIVFTHCIYGVGNNVINGYVQSLYNIPYLDFTADWWYGGMIEDYRIGTEAYYAAGDATIQNPQVTLFNKGIAAEYKLPDLYTTVTDGKWTLDYFEKLVRQVSVDLNGDSKITAEDKVGYAGDITEVLNAVLFACGETCSKIEDDGISLTFRSEKTFDIFERVFDLFNDTTVTQAYFRAKGSGQNFTDGRALFTWSQLWYITPMRDSDVDFGILPMPKYDEKQENYLSYAWNNFVCVPVTVAGDRMNTVGATLELFAYKSRDTVLDAFNDVLIRGKSVRDEESLAMLDIVYDGIVYDAGTNYLGFSANFSKIFYCFKQLVEKKDNAIASFYESYAAGAQTELDNLYDAVTARQ